MENLSPSLLQKKLFVCFYSDANFLSLNLLENLLSKSCLVNIVTTDIKIWKERTRHLNKSKFGITPAGENFIKQKYNYAIYCGGFLKKSVAYSGFNSFLADPAIQNIKSIAILPFETFSLDESKKMPMNDNLSVIYMGDILGPRMDLGSDLFIAQTINEILFERKLTVETGQSTYPLFVNDAAKIVSKWLFSFGHYGKEVFLLGPQTSAGVFWKENQNLIPELKLVYDDEIEPRKLPRGYEIKNVECNLRFALTETYKWVSKTWESEKNSRAISKIFVRKNKKSRPLPSFAKPLIIISLLILLLPFFTTVISASIVHFSYMQFVNKKFISGKDKSIESALLLSKTLFIIGKEESSFLANIPLLGAIYKETAFISWVGENVSDFSVEAFPLISNASSLFDKILGDQVYDSAIESREIKNTLGSFYKRLSLMQIEIKSSADHGIISAQKLLKKVDFERLKTLSAKGEILAGKLPVILGKDQNKAYLLLFENNMELRPTGGFIGSFGVTSFDGGRMNELIVNDVYSADGQLKGHVEPPDPIKNYLGEANWFLRDSNWDPDFPTSAQRAEWFLDKETDQKVDGVVSIDLTLVRDILKYTGPIFLPDFNLDITETNLYEKTQEEVQANFFPGTHKKASFLTALSRSLLDEVGKLDSSKKAHVIKAIFKNLEGRHIQAYLHDTDSENAISEIGWGGDVTGPNCGSGCTSDFLGLVEANLGVNKANYFIKRRVDLDVNLSREKIVKSVTLDLVNTANNALGLSGKYKTYVRLLVPQGSQILGVRGVVGENVQNLSFETIDIKDRKEIGLLIEVLGGQRQKIQFTWQLPLQNTTPLTSYGLYIRKQAGVGEDPWTIKVMSSVGKLDTSAGFSLTKEGSYTYNMNLRRDMVSLFKLKNE